MSRVYYRVSIVSIMSLAADSTPFIACRIDYKTECVDYPG